jgi:uncharacterized protein (TIGR03435 family)
MKIPVSLAVVITAATGILLQAAPMAQAPPAFDVVSVKRNLTGGPVLAHPEPRGFVVRNFSALGLVELAFGLPSYRVTGGPAWASSERYDLSAKTDSDATFAQMMAMLRTALAQRFQLASRMESREQPRFALVVDRPDGMLGPGLRRAAAECVPIVLPKDAPQPPPPPPGLKPGTCPSMFGPGFITARQVDLTEVVTYLAREPSIQRAVIDKTGLAGKYNVDATWSFDPGLASSATALLRINPDGPTLFTALREQLGLRLQPERGPVDVLVIERMERPTED